MRHLPIVLHGLLLVACGSSAGDFGATPGGVKDMRIARELVAKGVIPPSDAVLVEAMFAEHDLPLEGARCTNMLCLRTAAGYAPEIDGTPRGWVQIGLSSAVNPDNFKRPSTTFVFTVDVSGSMGWDSGGDGHPTPARLSQQLLHALADQLQPDDQVAIVTYGSGVDTFLSLRSGSERADVHAAIDELDEDGSTNMEEGMRRAQEIAEEALGQTRQVRVILFTDVQPNVGATSSSEFGEIVRDMAARDIHTTVLALGLGIGTEVMRGMASLRGANAFSLTRAEDVDSFMADEYPWFTTPIAYDLRVNFTDNAWPIDRGLGFPAASDEAQPGLKAETIFLSKRRGALLTSLVAPGAVVRPSGLRGTADISYEELRGVRATASVSYGYTLGDVDERGHWYQQRGVARTTALALFTEGMHEATKIYASDKEQAEVVMTAALERFEADAAALGDADLPVEVELGRALLHLIEQRATQGTLYGQQ